MNTRCYQSRLPVSGSYQSALVLTLLAVSATLPMACAPDVSEAEARAVAAVKQFDGGITCDPKDKGEAVAKIDLTGKPVSDVDVKVFAELAELHSLVLRQTRITDAGLAHLKTTGRLRVLDLDETRVTDAGLMHLGQLTSLRALYLAGTEVTDAGLAALRPLTKLRELGLRGTEVTDAGLIHLRGLNDLRVLDLRGTRVTGTGLAPLKGLTKLQRLYLSGTQVRSAGADEPQLALPNVKILR
jgi:Leucine-rich repeat (LRR) protein